MEEFPQPSLCRRREPELQVIVGCLMESQVRSDSSCFGTCLPPCGCILVFFLICIEKTTSLILARSVPKAYLAHTSR